MEPMTNETFNIQKATPIAYMAFGTDGESPVALCEYTGSTELAVLQKVLEVARREGFDGTAQERMSALGWWIEPVTRFLAVKEAISAERERCAKLCEDLTAYTGGHGEPRTPGGDDLARHIRAA